MMKFFAENNVSSFCNAKATHIFSAKNIRILYIESAKTVNEMTLNEFVKLTTHRTTGPCLKQISLHNIPTVHTLYTGTQVLHVLKFQWICGKLCRPRSDAAFCGSDHRLHCLLRSSDTKVST